MHTSELSLAICTHNRAGLLERLVDQIAPELESLGIALMVIDSASENSAAAAVAACVARYPVARLVRLDKPGVSVARNVALAATSSPWLAFIDDDEIPDQHWAEEALALIRRLPDDCGACSGETLPSWPPGATPPALGPRWRDYLSLSRQHGEFDQSDDPKFLIGHSLLRVEALRAAGGFDIRLGRDGTSLMSGEEVLLVATLLDRGWRIWYSDRIRVGHIIEPERLTPRWARDRAFWEGVSRARVLAMIDKDQSDALSRDIRWKRPLLRALALLCRTKGEFDLRAAFAHGVEVEQRRQQRGG